MRSTFFLAALALSGAATARSYDVDYTVEFLPATKQAAVTIALTPGEGRATHLDFAMDPALYTQVEGDGKVERKDGRLHWTPPKAGGQLRYRYLVNQQRKGGGYDALITKDWVIVRGDDLVPSARVRTTRRSDSRARLHFKLPAGWNGADTPYV